ncbi:MAG: polymerase LigD, polymerase domain protein [Pseudonocardiales bacterium]|nr:polymerase LigD, polymerase domain protein [Pseudonocardiales bacterium]
MAESARISVTVEERTLSLSNLDKVLFPEVGFTKGEVIDYYTRIAPVLLPHMDGRALTVIRYPNGIEAHSFFEKNAPRGTPDWVRTVRLPAPGSTKDRETIDYIVVEELATLVWLANLAALEMHTHQWRVDADGAAIGADQLVIDLDPGPPAGLAECAVAALLLRDLLVEDGLHPVVKTSGSKGMQMTVPIENADPGRASEYMRSLAQRLEREHPDLVLSSMKKALRPGKIFLDWSQNNEAKTTVTPYSLRARAGASVSTPLSWDEVEEGRLGQFDTVAVLERVERHGDLYAGALDDELRAPLPTP